MVTFMPVLGGQAIPSHMKVALPLMISVIVFPLVDIKHVTVEMDVLTMGLLIVGEAMIGLVTAFLVNLLFAAVQLAGALIDFQIGFGIVNVVDPITNAQVSVTGQLLNITAMLIFLSINAHHWVLMGLVDSFHTIPLGGFKSSVGLSKMFVQSMKAVYVTGMQIAAPVTVTLLLKQTAMGLIARTVPQVNIFIVGFPITIGLGLATIAICLPAFSKFLIKIFSLLAEQLQVAYFLMG